jgi:hypothetical protein
MKELSLYHGKDYDPTVSSAGDGWGPDYSNWDGLMIHVCRCELGYGGADCSQRKTLVFNCDLIIISHGFRSELCPRGDDPLTTGQDSRSFQITISSSSALSGSVTINFQDQTSIFSLDYPSDAQCKAALQSSPKFRDVNCEFIKLSNSHFFYNVTIVEWPESSPDNNLYSLDGNPSIKEFTCDVSMASTGVACSFADLKASNIKGKTQDALLILF